MDKLTAYRNHIKAHLSRIAELVNRRPTPGVETLCVFDEERDQYLLVKTGWARDHRVRATTLFVRLREGKIWVEEDWTEDGIATDLARAGVPQDDIILAFQPPASRAAIELPVA